LNCGKNKLTKRLNMHKNLSIIRRHPANPIISPADYPGVREVFNPSPVEYNGKIILLLSMIFKQNGYGGETRVAASEDGINFTIADKPFIELYKEPFPFNHYHKHVIDNRVTKIDDTYYILTPVGNDTYSAPATVLGKTKDFKTYEVIDIVTLPVNRGASLFPEKIGGMYCKLDRPGGGKGANFPLGGDIWLTFSPNLIHWGQCRPVIQADFSWGNRKIGPTPPIKTPAGWLVIIHGVTNGGDVETYRIGAMLLDLDEPWKVLGVTKEPLLAPEMPYEKNGRIAEVVFPCGAIADFKTDTLKLYYGGADTNICLATGSIQAIIDACLEAE
jgi:predicted GH43/DUF377 family glycosyl hydrolase